MLSFLKKSGDRATVLRAAGRSHPAAQGTEVILLGVNTGVFEALQSADGTPPVGWSTMRHVAISGDLVFPSGLKSSNGSLTIQASQPPVLYVVSHAWSGIAEVRLDRRKLEFDLYSSTPRVLRLDCATGLSRPLGEAEAIELRAWSREADRRQALRAAAPASISLTAAPARADLPILLTEVRRVGADERLDLAALAGGADSGWSYTPAAADAAWGGPALASSGGTLKLELLLPADLTFLARPGGGDVLVDFEGRTRSVHLAAARAEPIVVRLEADQPDAPSDAAAPVFFDLVERIDPYAQRLARLDPDQPIALYTPRWKGVAASTRNLFAQSLPIPETPEGHPNDITEADLERYTDLLLASGGRHFVVSGGDTYFLQIIDRVHAADPAIRFDLLWHSNYLQLGEEHDWNLTRHWLRALSDGKVRRIAVVKEGYENVFQALGIDAVFIPNVVRIDPARIVPSSVDDVVGVWLSGSSNYRKLPYASLQALALRRGLKLKASGLDEVALKLVSTLDLPIERVWRTPIPQDTLYREMAGTAATLYVTLSECSPMLPLESLGLGVPCLVGPSSHLFREHDYLRSRLVVEQPLSPAAIADQLDAAIAERDAIITAYRDYAQAEMEQARAAVDAFLS